jgi:hypothetical protein
MNSSNYYPPTTWLLFLWITILIITATTTQALYPDTKPYMDSCVGTVPQRCGKKPQCTWSVAQYPECFESLFLAQVPSHVADTSLTTRFFEFSYGVHLSEGNNNQWWLVDNTEECARKCFASATNGGIRCLSFDYYPMEAPLKQWPYEETIDTGICILNSENKDSARLRNSDFGLTDAELFYKSHFSHRPFSALEGYYELRDPRGGRIALMLEFNANAKYSTNNLWPRSRWGLMHLHIPPEIQTGMVCNGIDNAPDTGVVMPGGTTVSSASDVGARFYGAFTPVDESQHCPGMLTKQESVDMCAELGGYLCSADAMKKANWNNLGCGIDAFSIWTEDAAEFNKIGVPITKFLRCCADYGVLNFCPMYSKSQIDFCRSFKTASDCIMGGSGTWLQASSGFGKMMDQIHNTCAQQSSQRCRGLIRDWSARDACIWCLSPGVGDEGGAGECRAGNNYGVCQTATTAMQKLFALEIKALCDSATVCRIATSYSDKSTVLDVVTKSPTSKAPTVPTPKPSKKPSKMPTSNPTKPTTATPTTKHPTLQPTSLPSTHPVKPEPETIPPTSLSTVSSNELDSGSSSSSTSTPTTATPDVPTSADTSGY